MLSWDDEDDCYPESLESLKQVRHGGGGCEALVGDMSMYRRSQPGNPSSRPRARPPPSLPAQPSLGLPPLSRPPPHATR